jgi:hypothetical protein
MDWNSFSMGVPVGFLMGLLVIAAIKKARTP